LLAKRPVTADTHAWLNAWSSRASSLPQIMGSAWVKGLPGFRVRRKYTEDLCLTQVLNAPPRTVAQVCERHGKFRRLWPAARGGGRMDNQRQMPWHYSVGGSLLAKGPVQPIHMHGSLHGLREQAPSHRLWVRRGLKACPGFASGANTRRICAGFRLSMRRPPPWRRCVSVMASFGGCGPAARGAHG
jgi:hypothetical protein